MAIIVDAFVSLFAERLGALVEEEVVMLLGVKEDLQTLHSMLEMIRDILEDAERKRLQDKAIGRWLNRLKEVMYDADDIFDECRIEGEKCRSIEQKPSESTMSVSCCFPLCFCLHKVAFRHDIGKRIRSINNRLDKIAKERSAFQLVSVVHDVGVTQNANTLSRKTSPVVVDSDIVGIDEDTRSLVELLTVVNRGRSLVVVIVGMAGIGKTTLSQKIYNDERVKSHFEVKIWVCVSKDFSEIDVLKQIIRSAGGNYGEAQTREELEPMIMEVLGGKRYFLVLDDIWSEKIWEDLLRSSLHNSTTDSRILVTTRNEAVAKQMGSFHIHEVKLLSPKDGWMMLNKKVFGDNNEEAVSELRDIGLKIVDKCKGLPLAIKTIGGVLQTKEANIREWEKVLSSQTWNFTDLPEGIMHVLYLSYEDLPSLLKQCFVYCSLFPEDFQFIRNNLIQMWIAEGFVRSEGELAMEEIAEDYYWELVRRNLLQVLPAYMSGVLCKVHDLLRAVARFVAQHEYSFGDLQVLSTTSMKPRRLSIVNKELSAIPEAIQKQDCLKTLLLFNNPQIRNVPEDLFNKLERLGVLDLSNVAIECLPDSVGNLIHLRFLNLTAAAITELPESLQYLHNLQTLNLECCQYIQKLSRGTVKLCNLRHLMLYGTNLDQMPVGLGD